MDNQLYDKEQIPQRSSSLRQLYRSVAKPTTTGGVLSRYRKTEKLGEGTYGIVYKAEDLQTGEVRKLKTNLDLVRGLKEDSIR